MKVCVSLPCNCNFALAHRRPNKEPKKKKKVIQEYRKRRRKRKKNGVFSVLSWNVWANELCARFARVPIHIRPISQFGFTVQNERKIARALVCVLCKCDLDTIQNEGKWIIECFGICFLQIVSFFFSFAHSLQTTNKYIFVFMCSYLHKNEAI